ncbi:hypothetical protein LWI29_024697 [Acer saccharum]|uniref:Pentatricopeptide repeat-containing protein n=1 Tax=Acer saccharum TaxID=4024 RepID=A0AA39SQZ2_ACESA|nr:hypothetical protein LWI29_024697 [Acer saccharum]
MKINKFPIQDLISHCLNTSKTLNQLKQTHTLLIKTITKPQQKYHLTQFLTKLLQLPGDNLTYARNLFDQIPNCRRNQFLWTSLIRYHVVNAHFSQSIFLYVEMQQLGVSPSGFTFSSVLAACARIPAFVEGKQVHAKVVQLGFLQNKFVLTALLDMYAKCGFVMEARRVFDVMDDNDKDVTACTAMICGYTKMSMMDDARRLFDVTRERNVISWSAMVAGYANCGDMRAAKELYDRMIEKNSVTWVAMVAGYGKCGDVREAKRVFDGILELDASCWAAMVACYAQNGYAKESIEMYKAMREGNVRISEVAMVGAISACTQLGDIEMAAILDKHVEEGCCDRTQFVSNALIHMHAKCGYLEQARREFDRMKDRDVVSYSAMITALANHGKSKEAVHTFLKMKEEGIKPNQVTFIAVLNACSQGGLVEEGLKHFELMTQNFGIEPLLEHLTCMVDLLGKAGQLEKAYGVIMEYTNAVDGGVWGALLGACKVHGNAELGEIAARHLFEIEPDDAGNYVILANIYASVGKWKDAERVRLMMRERIKRKTPGLSWVSSLR